jgi:hypothetical protein
VSHTLWVCGLRLKNKRKLGLGPFTIARDATRLVESDVLNRDACAACSMFGGPSPCLQPGCMRAVFIWFTVISSSRNSQQNLKLHQGRLKQIAWRSWLPVPWSSSRSIRNPLIVCLLSEVLCSWIATGPYINSDFRFKSLLISLEPLLIISSSIVVLN